MTDTPTDDQPGFVAEEPEHCHACYRLIQPGQVYYLTIGQAILCESCIRTADAIRVSEDLVVVVEDDRLLVRRGDVAAEVFSHEGRRLVDALVEGVGSGQALAAVRSGVSDGLSKREELFYVNGKEETGPES